MKSQYKLVFSSILLASFAFIACSDDHVADSCGLTEDKCQSEGKTLDAKTCLCIETSPQACPITQEMCESANKTLDEDECLCVDGESPKTDCPEGQHAFEHACEDDSIENCGKHENNCQTKMTGWKSGTCTAGQCVASACNDDYHLYQNTCEINDTSHCGSHENNCATTQEGWKSGLCENGICQALTCTENMYLDNGLCKTGDASHCGTAQIDCATTVEGWETGDCIDGICQPTACVASYHLKDKKCEADSHTCCGNECKNCETDNQRCSFGECVKNCDPQLTTCGSLCVDTSMNPNHCGFCENDCSTNKPEHAEVVNCLDSQCTIASCESGYLPKDKQCVSCNEIEGYALCDGVCTYTNNDPQNCGACGKICDEGAVCINATCQGNTICDGTTTNTLTDVSHCGACNHRCENGKVCENAKCVKGQGNMYCNDVLINSLSDTANCSLCNKNCPKDYSCQEGSCQNYTLDAKTSLYCNGKQVFPYSDSSHCGKCGNECGNGQYCAAGVCTKKTPTSSTTTYCGGHLTHPYNDSLNCGGCGNECVSQSICVANKCTKTEITAATEHLCNGSLSYPYRDAQNCGKCGNACAEGKFCRNSKCLNYSSLEIGDYFTFGHYEQDNDTTNGKEPISWRVLDIKNGGNYVIISEKALDKKPYNTSNVYMTYDKSTLRSWLNGYGASYNTVGTDFSKDNFINAAFTSDEQSKIMLSEVTADPNPSTGITPGNATKDKIYLLSISEAQSYFTDDKARIAYATAYELGYTSSNTHSSDFWWLRTPGGSSYDAAWVQDNGTISNTGHQITGEFGVRPAMWLKF